MRFVDATCEPSRKKISDAVYGALDIAAAALPPRHQDHIRWAINDLHLLVVSALTNLPESTPGFAAQRETLRYIAARVRELRQFSFRSVGALLGSIRSGDTGRRVVSGEIFKPVNIESLGVDPLDQIEAVVQGAWRAINNRIQKKRGKRGPAPWLRAARSALRQQAEGAIANLAAQLKTPGALGKRTARSRIARAVVGEFDRLRPAVITFLRSPAE